MKAKRYSVPMIISETPLSKRMKVSNNKEKPEEEEYDSSHQDSSGKGESSPEKVKDRRTMPCTSPARQKILKSTEEQELEKSMKTQQEEMEIWKKDEELKTLALAVAEQPVKKLVSQVTKSVSFHFHTGEWIKQHSKNQEEYKEVNFISELWKYPPSPTQVTKGDTIIKPFNLSQGKKRTFDDTASSYVPLA